MSAAATSADPATRAAVRATPRRRRRTGSVRASWLALGLYLVAAALFFGRDVWHQLDSTVIGANDVDPSGFIWCLAWWPHAVLHGTDPFYTHAIYTPEGYNLLWAASLPGPAIVLAPITLLTSPTVTFNLLMLLSPPLSAWAAFALCRHVTGRFWPSVLGGYLFGFSPYMLGTLRGGAPNLSFVALVPLMVLLVVRRVEGSVSTRRFVVLFALAMVAQVLTGTEIALMATVFGALTLITAWLLQPGRRAALGQAVKALVAAYLLAGVALTPALIAVLRPHVAPTHANPRGFANDIYSLIVPDDLVLGGTRQARAWSHLGLSYLGASQAFLGIPLIALLVAFTWSRRRDRRALLLPIAFAICLFASFGARLIAGSRARFTLPWELAVHVPVLRYAIPMRFTVFAYLAAAVIVATWLSQRPAPARWALALVAVAFLLPNATGRFWYAPAPDPPLFRTTAYRALLHSDDNVLTIPLAGRNMRWAARTGIGFRIAGGYVGSLPASFTSTPTWQMIDSGVITPSSAADLRRYIRAKHVTAVAVEQWQLPHWRRLLGTLGVPPRAAGGMVVYRVRNPSAGG